MRTLIAVLIVFVLLPLVQATSTQNSSKSLGLVQKYWQRQDKLVDLPRFRSASSRDDPRVKILYSGFPLTTPRGIEEIGGALYVADAGRSAKPGVSGVFAPARILRFPLSGNQVGRPEVFFEDEKFLINAKWIAHGQGNTQDSLYIADQGEELPGFINTGKGAKIFRLPILPNGKAGKPVVLYEGSPLVCPTGIAVIASTVFFTDSCAGPMRNRVELPTRFFPSTIIYALPLAGGKLTKAWEGAPFTTAIGLCHWSENGKTYLIVNDLNSGRINWKRKDFPSLSPEAGAEIWRVPILGLNPVRVGAPERIPITEDGAVSIRIPELPSGAQIIVQPKNGTRFPNGSQMKIFTSRDVGSDGTLSITFASLAHEYYVDLAVTVRGANGDIISQAEFQLEKDPDQDVMFGHNKHGGLITPGPAAPVEPPTPGSTSSGFYFTIDEGYEPGMGTVWLYRPGMTPMVLARGGILKRPLAGELSGDKSVLWVTDQIGALVEVSFPPRQMLERMFPYTSASGAYR